VMYTESISGKLLGLIPITFDPENPPPLNIPLIYFTDVTVQHAGQCGGTATPLLPLQPSGARTVLFCVHPASGLAHCFQSLAVHLPETPLWGLQASEGASTGDSLEAVAEAYVAALREVQPRGPYRLLGWSLGGRIAHAMACHLEAAGERVSQLALLDSPAGLAGPPLSDAALAARVQAEMARWAALLPDRPAAGEAELAEELLARLRRAERLLRDHRPGRCTAPILLVRAARLGQEGSPSDDFDWQPHSASSVWTVTLDCTHDELLDPVWAALVGRHLEAAR